MVGGMRSVPIPWGSGTERPHGGKSWPSWAQGAVEQSPAEPQGAFPIACAQVLFRPQSEQSAHVP